MQGPSLASSCIGDRDLVEVDDELDRLGRADEERLGRGRLAEGHVRWLEERTWVEEERRRPDARRSSPELRIVVGSFGAVSITFAPFDHSPTFLREKRAQSVTVGMAGVSPPNDPTLVRTKVLIDNPR